MERMKLLISSATRESGNGCADISVTYGLRACLGVPVIPMVFSSNALQAESLERLLVYFKVKLSPPTQKLVS